MIRLIVRDAEGGEAAFPVTGPLLIGRSRECDVCLADTSVSRNHARVFLDYGDAVVEDLGTPNGTLVNGERITGKVRLKPGDLIQIAGERVRVMETNPLDDYAATTRVRMDDVIKEESATPTTNSWDAPITARATVAPGEAAATAVPAATKTRQIPRDVVLVAAVAAIAIFAIIAVWLTRS
jgi:pSer/pThr/pTyr-binding forkhead associated (FHA) protein